MVSAFLQVDAQTGVLYVSLTPGSVVTSS